jgi:hypothetical protein
LVCVALQEDAANLQYASEEPGAQWGSNFEKIQEPKALPRVSQPHVVGGLEPFFFHINNDPN